MIKACTMIRRKPGMSLEAFRNYWLNRHPEVVCKLPGLRRYVQNHPLMGGYRKGDLVFDGVAEVWVDDSAAMRAMSAAPEYAAVEADEEAFIDRSSMVLLLTEEHVIKDGPVPQDGVKNIEFVTRRDGMEVEPFQAYWRDTHGPIAAEIPVIRRYVQSHTRLSGYGRAMPPAYDGLAITWFDSVDDMREGATTDAYARTREDEPNFIIPGDPPTLITKEHVIVG